MMLLKKYITSKTKGTLIMKLDDGDYLVEYKTDEGWLLLIRIDF